MNATTMTCSCFFEVTDAARLEELLRRCSAENAICIREFGGSHAFSCNGSIDGLTEAPSYDRDAGLEKFYKELRQIIEPNSACAIMDIGHSGAADLHSAVVVVTKKSVKTIDMRDVAQDSARLQLSDQGYLMDF